MSRVGTLDYMAPEVLSAPSIPPGQNFRVPVTNRSPGSYDHTVRLHLFMAYNCCMHSCLKHDDIAVRKCKPQRGAAEAHLQASRV